MQNMNIFEGPRLLVNVALHFEKGNRADWSLFTVIYLIIVLLFVAVNVKQIMCTDVNSRLYFILFPIKLR